MKKEEEFCNEFLALVTKYGYKGHAWAVCTGDINRGYGASWPDGTEKELLKKLKTIISDIDSRGVK